MKLRQLFEDKYHVLAVMEGDSCPALEFIIQGEANTKSNREALLQMLIMVSRSGFDELPFKWTHEANKEEQIYEFRKGDLRLFYFKGAGNEIAICALGAMKKDRKADKAAVARAVEMKKHYWAAKANNTCEVITDETQ